MNGGFLIHLDIGLSYEHSIKEKGWMLLNNLKFGIHLHKTVFVHVSIMPDVMKDKLE